MPLDATRLRELRTKHGYTQEELADRLNLGIRQIYRYESGESDPSSDVVVRLARELEVTTDYLLGTSDIPNPPISENDLSPDEAKLVEALRRGDKDKALQLLAFWPQVQDKTAIPPRKPAANG